PPVVLRLAEQHAGDGQWRAAMAAVVGGAVGEAVASVHGVPPVRGSGTSTVALPLPRRGPLPGEPAHPVAHGRTCAAAAPAVLKPLVCRLARAVHMAEVDGGDGPPAPVNHGQAGDGLAAPCA